MTLIKIAKTINKIMNKHSVFNISVDEQRKFVAKFKTPQNLFERSYYQYKCQSKLNNKILNMINNIISFFTIGFIIIKFRYLNSNVKTSYSQVDAVATWDFGERGLLNDEINERFLKIITLSDLKGSLNSRDMEFIYKIAKKYFYQPYFILKCIFRIAIYSNAIIVYKPRAILAYAEYSFTSSVLTAYCRNHSIKHINIMHGEKLYDIRDAFVEFDEYYVWDEHYVSLLTKLNANSKQFKIALPHKLLIPIKVKIPPRYVLTYYLGNENESEMIKIRESLIKTKFPINKVCIRYHPRFSDVKKVNRIFKQFEIQEPDRVSIHESISISTYIVSLYSSVLFEAYLLGTKIVIDNVSNHERYNKLKKMHYIMLSKPHILLSELKEEVEK